MYTKLRLIDPPWDRSFLDLLSGDFLNGYRKVGVIPQMPGKYFNRIFNREFTTYAPSGAMCSVQVQGSVHGSVQFNTL